MPAYKNVLKLGQERKGALLLDIGCCFGNDARKAALDGFPAEQIIASDLQPELWDLGHVLFRSTPKSFPATFVAGDVLDPTFLSPLKFLTGAEPLTQTWTELSNIRSLNDLRGKVSAIWASSFFHLFSESSQRRVAHALGSLLSPECGSIIFGSHIALPSKGENTSQLGSMFCHDPDSWKEMWVGRSDVQSIGVDLADSEDDFDAAVFPPNCVKLDSKLIPVESKERQVSIFVWSITRI